MCGIAGLIDPQLSREARERAVSAMCARMIHRGPDDRGLESASSCTLGMRRLAIFDPANGHQPMRSPDGVLTLIFNGAIYNFRSLRSELKTAGWEFRTDCDTEVLLAAYAQWGENCVARLRGMFAFAIWNEQEQTLFLARDPFGIKPLYFRHDGPRFIFASELNALLASGVCPAEIDPVSVRDYLAWLAVPAPRTIYRDILSLAPGEGGLFHDSRFERRRAWRFPTGANEANVATSREEFVAELRVRLDETVRAHAVADVPVGAFLSGGLDSAVIVGLMTRATAAPLRTFSVGFSEVGYSETAAAEATARHFGTIHHASILTGADVARDVNQFVGALDQPTGDGLNTFYASQAARAGGVTVALSGLGGDEVLGGYPSFRDVPRLARWLPLWRRAPQRVRRALVVRLRRGNTRQRKLADFLQHARHLHETAALHRRVFDLTTQTALLGRESTTAENSQEPFHPLLATLESELPHASDAETVSAWELRTYMTDVLLRDSDVMSMRHSLELRVPFVDRCLIEWLWQQPAAFKFDRSRPKSALFDAVRDLLPPELEQRAKRGFTLPFPLWMKRELRPFLDETFSDASLKRCGLLARPAAQSLWREFLQGTDPREWSRVWSLAMLVAFANRPPATQLSPRQQPVVAIKASAEDPPTKRALLLAPEIFASEGGIPRILQLYLRALCDRSAVTGSVRLLALNDHGISADALRRCGADTVGEAVGCAGNKTRFVRAALRMSRGSDVIICGHVAQLPVAWLAQRVNPRLRYYLVAHGLEVWRPFSFLERTALRHAETIFCVSQFTREQLQRQLPLPSARVVVLPNALDPAFPIVRGVPLAECAPVLLCVTRLTQADRYKGVDHLIAALPLIRAAIPAARLRIIGRGDDVPRLQAMRDQLGLHDSVEFLGYVEDGRLRAELRTCRLFALPSEKEGFGLVFLEAMAQGRPGLGARAGGVPEVITPASGVLAEYGNVSDLATAAIAALQRPWDEEAIMDRARHFSYDRFRAQLAARLATDKVETDATAVV